MSDELNQHKERTKIERALKNNGMADFISSVDSMTKEELSNKLLNLAKHEQHIVSTMQRDDQLKDAKEKVKVLKQPYNEQRNMNKKMARYVGLVMEDRGYEWFT